MPGCVGGEEGESESGHARSGIRSLKIRRLSLVSCWAQAAYRATFKTDLLKDIYVESLFILLSA